MTIHLCTAYGCPHTIIADLNSCDKDHLVLKAQNNYLLALFRKRLLTPNQAGMSFEGKLYFLASFKVFFL